MWTRGHSLLRGYLRKTGKTVAAFAADVQEAAGRGDRLSKGQRRPPAGTIRRVLNGGMPTHTTRRTIAIAAGGTLEGDSVVGGEVPVESWGEAI
jgi:hypothetical protein